MALLVVFYADRLNPHILKIWCAAAGPVHAWYQEHSTKSRNINGSSAWWKSQCSGQFMLHDKKDCAVMTHQHALDDIGVWLASSSTRPWPDAQKAERHGWLLQQYGMAELMDMFSIALMKYRVVRGFNFIQGWSYTLCNGIDNTDVCDELLGDLYNHRLDGTALKPPYAAILIYLCVYHQSPQYV